MSKRQILCTPLLVLILIISSISYTFAHRQVVVVPLGADSDIASLQAEINELKSLLSGVTRIGSNIYFTGVNVHIRNGSGSTAGSTNSLGNLIIGYNEPRGCPPATICLYRKGSHNLILGEQHIYSSFGGIVSGWSNKISGQHSVAIAGQGNQSKGSYSATLGGAGNATEANYSTITGGISNLASGGTSHISGGRNNETSGPFSVVSGGRDNRASGSSSTLSGGYNRSISGEHDWRAGSLFETQ